MAGARSAGSRSLSENFDAKVLAELLKQNPESELPRWTLHDLRRTARSLMSRAGVPSDHAERCLGHVLPGIRGTYDRHEYLAEKRRAFDALAAQIDRVVNPAKNVVSLAESRAKAVPVPASSAIAAIDENKAVPSRSQPSRCGLARAEHAARLSNLDRSSARRRERSSDRDGETAFRSNKKLTEDKRYAALLKPLD
jgi:hypothetical protein